MIDVPRIKQIVESLKVEHPDQSDQAIGILAVKRYVQECKEAESKPPRLVEAPVEARA